MQAQKPVYILSWTRKGTDEENSEHSYGIRPAGIQDSEQIMAAIFSNGSPA